MIGFYDIKNVESTLFGWNSHHWVTATLQTFAVNADEFIITYSNKKQFSPETLQGHSLCSLLPTIYFKPIGSGLSFFFGKNDCQSFHRNE